MTMEYIRQMYQVPAKRGRIVEYTGGDNVRRRGYIVGSAGAHLRIRLDGEKLTRLYHPTDDYLVYLPGASHTNTKVNQ